MSDNWNVDELQEEGYIIDSVGIQMLSADPQKVWTIKVSISLQTLRDFSAMVQSMRKEIYKYLNGKYHSDVDRVRIYAILRKDIPIGENVKCPDVVINEPNQVEEYFNQLINLTWKREI